MAIPLLLKILGGLLVGVAGLTLLQHPEVAKSAQPSVGVVLVEHMTGSPTSGTVFAVGDHLLVTANHVVQSARHIVVKFQRTEWVDASVIESDSIADVAVLSYEGPDVPALPLGDFGQVKPGENAILLAFPSVEDLAKKGQNKDVQAEAAKSLYAVEGTVRSIRGSLLVINTPDVPRNGGPVLNLKGQVVGVVRGHLEVLDTPGVGYAAPATAIESALAAVGRKRASEAAAQAPPQPAPASQASSGSTPPSQPAAAATQPSTPGPSQQGASSSASAGSSQSIGTQVAPAVAPSAATPFLIIGGQSVGFARLGMPIKDEITRLGPSKGVSQMDDGTATYRWFEPPANAGIGLRTAQNGTVYMAWVLNDDRYRTKEGLHVGSSEAEVRAALGAPTRVEVNSQAKTRTLIYESLGLWFSIQLDQQYAFYNAVHDIGVMEKK